MRAPTRDLSAHGDGPRSGRLGALLLGLSIGAAGCALAGDGPAKADFETRLIVQDATGKTPRSFGAGRAVTLTITIRNRSGVPRTLTLPTSRTHDVVIYDEARTEVWRWSAGRMFAQVITEITLAPGETRSYTVAWDQTDHRGARVPPGDYRAVGLVAGDAPGCSAEPVPFTIVP